MYDAGNIIEHQDYGRGTILETAELFYTIDFGKLGIRDISRRSEELLRLVEETTYDMDKNELEKSLIRILESYSDISQVIEMGDRWKGGTLVLKPANASQKSKEIPIDTFFHKIVMVRDRLRVLEQNINSHDKLDDADKINLQQYITRVYGSLTTFNLLFKNEEDHFSGEKKDE
jgi:hypothetical protein